MVDQPRDGRGNNAEGDIEALAAGEIVDELGIGQRRRETDHRAHATPVLHFGSAAGVVGAVVAGDRPPLVDSGQNKWRLIGKHALMNNPGDFRLTTFGNPLVAMAKGDQAAVRLDRRRCPLYQDLHDLARVKG